MVDEPRRTAELTIGLPDIVEAARTLDGVAHRTPVVRSTTLNRLSGANVFLKAENLQRTGSFKFRGAYVAASRARKQAGPAGFVTSSSGNHGQALALAGQLLDMPVTVVMPWGASEAKVEATKSYGAHIRRYQRGIEDRFAVCEQIQQKTGAVVVPPYDHPLVMAGQGTVALELLAEVGPLDILLIPVGGGGLSAGCSTAAKSLLGQRVRIVGVEPVGADDTQRSLRAGRPVRVAQPSSIADGALAEIPGALTFGINKRTLNDVVTVSDDEIIAAMIFALERLKLLIEPTGALTLAAIMFGRVPVEGKRVGAVLSGGNVSVQDVLSMLAVGAESQPGQVVPTAE